MWWHRRVSRNGFDTNLIQDLKDHPNRYFFWTGSDRWLKFWIAYDIRNNFCQRRKLKKVDSRCSSPERKNWKSGCYTEKSKIFFDAYNDSKHLKNTFSYLLDIIEYDFDHYLQGNRAVNHVVKNEFAWKSACYISLEPSWLTDAENIKNHNILTTPWPVKWS